MKMKKWKIIFSEQHLCHAEQNVHEFSCSSSKNVFTLRRKMTILSSFSVVVEWHSAPNCDATTTEEIGNSNREM